MIDWMALAQVAIAGIVLGAGIPALFAIGTKLLSPSQPLAGSGEGVETQPVSAGRKALAFACYGICIAAIIAGVFFLAAGGHS